MRKQNIEQISGLMITGMPDGEMPWDLEWDNMRVHIGDNQRSRDHFLQVYDRYPNKTDVLRITDTHLDNLIAKLQEFLRSVDRKVGETALSIANDPTQGPNLLETLADQIEGQTRLEERIKECLEEQDKRKVHTDQRSRIRGVVVDVEPTLGTTVAPTEDKEVNP